MNKRFKKLLSAFMSVIVTMACLSAAIPAHADDYVAINSINFPDAVWRSAVSEYADIDEDGFLSVRERSLTTLPVSGWIDEGAVIKNLKGIEFFTSAKRLRIGDLGLESLDVSALTQLEALTAQGNRFESLDVSANYALTDLDCRGNSKLSSLVLNSSITKLQCDECNLTELDVSMCTGLETLTCYANKLTALNLSQNPALSNLNCSYNNISNLDLSANQALNGSITAYHIGNQQIVSTASFSGEILYVPVTVANADNISTSNIKDPNSDTEIEPDPDDSVPDDIYTGYDASLGAFALTDYDLILNGIDYTYNVGLSDAEDMTVHVNVIKDFFRVRYLSQQENGTLIKTQYVNTGSNATPPPMPKAPEGKTCGVWNAQANNITQDTDIFVLWNSEHPYELLNFSNKTAVVYCGVCFNTYRTAFIDHVNAVSGSEDYLKVLDVNNDGTINARDYAILIQMF